MTVDPSLWGYVANAGLVVKVVMLILALASVISWALIFQRATYLKQARRAVKKFEDQFWSGVDLNRLYQGLHNRAGNLQGMERIFYAGFKEYTHLREKPGTNLGAIMDGIERAMRVAKSRELDALEYHLPFLATGK